MCNLPATHCPNEETCNKICYELVHETQNPHHYEDMDDIHFRIAWESMEDCRKRIDHILNHQK